MRTLAAGVGDLKKVLTNVKTRGTWGEVQLGALLEQVLAPDQYQENVATRAGAGERVEYAIRLPGHEGLEGSAVWLPIDAKFPVEDYSRLLEAEEQADPAAADLARRQLEGRIKAIAKDIRDKYLDPPATTDFGIMFLPTEGLYAEVLRRPGLVETLQCEYRVTVAGPVTLTAILNSLQMGFRTLAIQKRSGEVWQLLGAVKTQFAQFGETLDKVSTRLHQATDTLDLASRRTRAIERKLKEVEGVSAEEAGRLLQDAVDAEQQVPSEAPGAIGSSEEGLSTGSP
jgi:DNA recombination protein RmuC